MHFTHYMVLDAGRLYCTQCGSSKDETLKARCDSYPKDIIDRISNSTTPGITGIDSTYNGHDVIYNSDVDVVCTRCGASGEPALRQPCSQPEVTLNSWDKTRDKSQITVTATGAKSSPSLPFDQIPYRALVKTAERFQKGNDKGLGDNWRKGLGDLDYVLERLSHGQNHLARLIEKVSDDRRGVTNPDAPKWKGEYWDDDVAAVLWACCLVVETVWQKEWEMKREWEERQAKAKEKLSE